MYSVQEKLKFAVTDIETTGGGPSIRSITEVAVIITDGQEILDEYQSLVNPHTYIPEYITALTGITNEMVSTAPSFEEIAEELYSKFEDAIFVAHNVNFDYSFLKAAFETLDYSFNKKKLCTVRYSRKLFPGQSSYSLGALCRAFEFQNDNPHRAMNDTLMAFKLLQKGLQADEEHSELTDFLKNGRGDAFLPMHLNKEEYHQLPERPGVYYFKNTSGKVIYVGKAKNIKKRVRQHFSGKLKSKKKQQLIAELKSIDYQLAGNELVAALIEDREIKKLWPKYNSAQKQLRKKYGVFSYEDRTGALRLAVQSTKGYSKPLASFNSTFTARKWLFEFREKYELPYERLGLPVLGEEPECSTAEANQLLKEALHSYQEESESYVIIGSGRNRAEHTLILVENSEFKGYGFVEEEQVSLSSLDDIKDHIEVMSHSEFSISVINYFMEQKKAGKVVQL